jgi:metallo-beta-lactamase class B
MKKTLLSFVLALAGATALHAQTDPVWRSWNQPVEPFRIMSNIYYVGASDIASYLITTPAGHIVIDGGFAETAPMIARNIEKLGFRLHDVHILLSSHAHVDHAGGLAELRRLTGARLLVSRADAPLMERGGLDDPQFADRAPYPPVRPDQLLEDGSEIKLGGTVLTAHLTAGHTRGCTTWTTTVKEQGKQYDVVFVGSATAPDYKLVGNTKYPGIIQDFRKTFVVLASLRCDVFLGAHGGYYDLEKKRKLIGQTPNPFIDPAGYRKYVAAAKERFEELVKKQAAPSVAAVAR